MTSGRIRVVCAPEATALMGRERSAFQALYPQAEIEVRPGTSREAISALYAAEADLAVIGRELEPAERNAAAEGGLDLEGYRFARDALVMVVHPQNPVENISVDDIQRVCRGELTQWNEMGGRTRPVVPVLQSPEVDLMGFLVQEVLAGETPRARALQEPSDSAVVARVLDDFDAIGCVTLAGADRGARALRVAALTGLSYWKPDLEAVYTGDYPLTRYLNMFVRSDGPKLAQGFITFVTSTDGQRIVHESGFVPTTVPVRFVRRSPMMSTHDE
jgi:phosphate transport system substrate-binding protein